MKAMDTKSRRILFLISSVNSSQLPEWRATLFNSTPSNFATDSGSPSHSSMLIKSCMMVKK